MSDPKPNLKKGWNGTPNQATNLFLVPVVERLQVPLHNPVHLFHSSHNNTRLVSEPSISATSFYCSNSWDMRSSEEKVQNALDSLSDGVEGVGPGVHVHHVGPLRRLNLLVPCSATRHKAKQKYRRRRRVSTTGQ